MVEAELPETKSDKDRGFMAGVGEGKIQVGVSIPNSWDHRCCQTGIFPTMLSQATAPLLVSS